MIPLNYNQLYYFYKIAEHGSIAAASKAILISSPALSMQLKELEESFGTPLFNRVGKKMVLTEAGQIVCEYARDIFHLGVELKQTINSHAEKRTTVKIGCQDTIPKKIVDELVIALIKKSCKVVLKEGNKEELLKLQNDYKLDVVVTNSLPQGENHAVQSKLLKKESLILVGHQKFLTNKSKWPKILGEVPLVLSSYDSETRYRLDSFFKEKGITPDIIAEVEDKATEMDLAIKGFGLIVVMKSTVKHLFKTKQLVEYGKFPSIEEEIWLVAGERKISHPIVQFLMNKFSLPNT